MKKLPKWYLEKIYRNANIFDELVPGKPYTLRQIVFKCDDKSNCMLTVLKSVNDELTLLDKVGAVGAVGELEYPRFYLYTRRYNSEQVRRVLEAYCKRYYKTPLVV
ncbi:MAG: hypothetical protein QW063_00700 [Candidatus Nanoarchaeia archaeon]